MQVPFTIRHDIPGRLRFKIPALHHSKASAQRYEAAFKPLKGVRWAGANPASASLVVRFDTGMVNRGRIIDELHRISGAKPAPRKRKKSTPKTLHAPLRDEDLAAAVRRFVGLSALTGIVFVREAILKRPLAQNLASPLGIVTTLLALPLVKKGFVKMKEGKVSLESFLGGSIIAAIAAGEATAALEILWVTSGGELLQHWITDRSRLAIQDILQVTEKETYILKDGVEVSVPVDRVRRGNTVVLHTGEKIGVDGEILKGEALVDESPITGHAHPTPRKPGDTVYAGTLVRQGVIFVKASQVGDRTYLSRILTMVEESLVNKAPIEGEADRLAKRLITAGFATTLITLALTRSLWRAFTVMLVMACPCATILAASTAVSAAISAAAKRHILIKGGRYLEEAGKAEVICFDKTGTLTTNEPELKHIERFTDISENEMLQLAYSTEIHNSHPVALALKKEARKRKIEPVHHDVCEYILGKGVRSEIHGDEILAGSHKLMAQFEVDPDRVTAHFEGMKKQGLTLVFIARNRELLGVTGFANREREDVGAVIDCFRKEGIQKTAMITGDSKYSAMEMATRLKFDECRYSVLPEEKADIVNHLKENGRRVLMVGDGINDALALAEADIGIAMGAGGSEVAIEAADIALVKDDLKDVVYVRALSRKTINIVHENFWIATGTNIAGVSLGALGILTPVTAGLLHIVHTLGILANSSRLLFFESPLRITPEGATCSAPSEVETKKQPQVKKRKQKI